MATKKLICPGETGLTVYCIARRESDGYRLNDADGAFASNPADPYLSLTEDTVIKGLYEVSEARTVWTDGRYTFTFYSQAGGSPAPVSDTVIGAGEMYVKDDAEVVLDDSVAAIKVKTDTIEWADITDLHDEAFGRWTLDPTAKTLTLYRGNGTVLKVFDLTDTASTVPAFIQRTPA